MQESGGAVAPNEHCFVQALPGLAGAGDVDSVRRILGRMRAAGLEPHRKQAGVVVLALAVRGRAEEALAALDEMAARGTPPRVVEYMLGMRACRTARRSDVALRLLDHMRATGVPPDADCHRRAMTVLAESGDWAGLAALWRRMKAAAAEDGSGGDGAAKAVATSQVRETYFHMMSLLVRGEQVAEAENVYHEALAAGVVRHWLDDGRADLDGLPVPVALIALRHIFRELREAAASDKELHGGGGGFGGGLSGGGLSGGGYVGGGNSIDSCRHDPRTALRVVLLRRPLVCELVGDVNVSSSGGRSRGGSSSSGGGAHRGSETESLRSALDGDSGGGVGNDSDGETDSSSGGGGSGGGSGGDSGGGSGGSSSGSAKANPDDLRAAVEDYLRSGLGMGPPLAFEGDSSPEGAGVVISAAELLRWLADSSSSAAESTAEPVAAQDPTPAITASQQWT
ncbi:unnamed protein product [Phaeothamnion confervicola]